jgi:hypothetical protein
MVQDRNDIWEKAHPHRTKNNLAHVPLASGCETESLIRGFFCTDYAQREAIQWQFPQHLDFREAEGQLEESRISGNASSTSDPVSFRFAAGRYVGSISTLRFDRLQDQRRLSAGADDRRFKPF